MRLSDAIGLGRTLVAPEQCTIWGCALGMANASISGLGYMSVEEQWPWIKDKFFHLPCACKGYRSAEGVIIHLFDWEVMEKGNWTLDQLIDWVRSVEPVEATPQIEQAVAESVVHAEVIK